MDYEDYLFHKYKDKVVLRKKFVYGICSKFSGVEGSKIYNRIVNYQIKKYGSQLSNISLYNSTPEEVRKGWRNKKCRRHYQGLRKNVSEY